ncbi:cyclic nucleotide-binding domain-containing protein [Pseudomonas fluorescens]|uniref:Cyclic nucleotide-binding domain-containing protein n=1 Tax=Pseudomonas fluorescens TaxID=294 RepID=A0A5E7AWR9_PSEFL|nr:cyclic nucleotide-binding domain-containing protein [Pseudomonas fluorescens]VVN83115.1 hypothetical protein PS691_01255 [Pseudomonas fluorescens]
MPDTRPLQIHALKTTCSSCTVLELCLPIGLTGEEVERLDTLIVQRFKVKKGAALYRAGEPLRSLYAVRIGSFKTSVLSLDGREQVTGFQMPGEMLGLDAISTDLHACNALALEDSEVCPIHCASSVQTPWTSNHAHPSAATGSAERPPGAHPSSCCPASLACRDRARFPGSVSCSDCAEVTVAPERVSPGELDTRHLRVTVEGATVKLEGRVHLWRERKAAEHAAWAVPGVTNVENLILIA